MTAISTDSRRKGLNAESAKDAEVRKDILLEYFFAWFRVLRALCVEVFYMLSFPHATRQNHAGTSSSGNPLGKNIRDGREKQQRPKGNR